MRQSVLLAALARVLSARMKPEYGPETLEFAADRFSSLIDDARRQAIADGVRPIPAAVTRALLGYFPATLLQKCRYITGSYRALNLPAPAPSYGDAMAITVGDVVLFKHEKVALTDLPVWAHELTHVMQYQRWGVDGFAERYVRDADAIEREAIDNAERFSTWLALEMAPGIGGRSAGSRPDGGTPATPRPSSRRSPLATFR